MNTIESGKVFSLLNELSYKEGSAQKTLLLEGDCYKLLGITIDHGELPEHPAPMDALVFAAEGSAIITYDGKDYPIKAGENFKFDTGVLHSIRTDGQYKMFLLLYK